MVQGCGGSELCQRVHNGLDACPDPVLVPVKIFQIRIIDSSGLVGPAGQLIEVVAGIPEKGNQFFELSQLQPDNMAIDCHFTDIRGHIIRTKLLHLLVNQIKFLLGDTELDDDIPVCHITGKAPSTSPKFSAKFEIPFL